MTENTRIIKPQLHPVILNFLFILSDISQQKAPSSCRSVGEQPALAHTLWRGKMHMPDPQAEGWGVSRLAPKTSFLSGYEV